MTFFESLTLRPTTRTREIVVSNELLDTLPNPEPESIGMRGHLKPLPLAQVLKNIEAIHSDCNGEHVCGLPKHLQRFDLNSYLKLSREAL